MESTRKDLAIESKSEKFVKSIPYVSHNHEESEALYREFIGHPLVGVYNVRKQEVLLMPCMKERVSLHTQNHEIISGEIVETGNGKLERVRSLTPKELEECKHSRYAPRFLFAGGLNKISAHQYLLESLDIPSHKHHHFRGFTVFPEIEFPVMEWKSNGLNCPDQLWEFAKVELEQPIAEKAKMHPALQDEVKQIIKKWSRPLDPIHKLLIDTYENAKEKMMELLESFIADINKREEPFILLQLSHITHYCILMNRLDLAKPLAAEYEIDLNTYHPRDKNYAIHLLVADAKPDVDFIRFVCEKRKVNLSNENRKNETALSLAIKYNHTEIASYFASLAKHFTQAQIARAVIELLKKKQYDLANKLLDQQVMNFVLAIQFFIEGKETDLDCIRYLCEYGKDKVKASDERLNVDNLWDVALKKSKGDVINLLIESIIIQYVSTEALGSSLFSLLSERRFEIAYALLKARKDIEIQEWSEEYFMYLAITKDQPHMGLIQILSEEIDKPINLSNALLIQSALNGAIEYSHWKLAHYFINTPALLNQFSEAQLAKAVLDLIEASQPQLALDILAQKPETKAFNICKLAKVYHEFAMLGVEKKDCRILKMLLDVVNIFCPFQTVMLILKSLMKFKKQEDLGQFVRYLPIFSLYRASEETKMFKGYFVEALIKYSKSASAVMHIIRELMEQEKQKPFLKAKPCLSPSALFAPAVDELLFKLVQFAKKRMVELGADDEEIINFLNTPMSYKESVTGCKEYKCGLTGIVA